MPKRILNKEEITKRLSGTNIELISEYKGTEIKAKFKCFCGNTFETLPIKVFTKRRKSCGCLPTAFEKKRRKFVEQFVGEKIGKLKVVAFKGKFKCKENHSKTKNMWTCLCDCGNTIDVREEYLKYGETNSCGCSMYQYQKGKNNYMWKGKGDISARFFHGIKSNARHRKIGFNLTIDYLWKLFLKQNGKCSVTGEQLSFGAVSREQSDTTASLDRIDSTKGYLKGNVRWVHKIVNEMKFDLDTNRFFNLCYLVINPIIGQSFCGIEPEKRRNTPGWAGHKNLSLTYWNSVLRHAKDRNIVVRLSICQAWNIFEKQKGHCAITGLPLKWGYKSKQTASLDRINSNKEYTIDNVQWTHKDINKRLKKDLSESELKKWCQKIIDFPKNKAMIDKARECPVYEV